MSKHTPGPWHIWSLGSRDMYIGPPQDIGQPAVAIVPLWVSTRGAQLPNARLIAAAPELMEALQDLVVHLEQGAYAGEDLPPNHPMHVARAAITKATGETT